jgi:SAM-dependent methyltransferase
MPGTSQVERQRLVRDAPFGLHASLDPGWAGRLGDCPEMSGQMYIAIMTERIVRPTAAVDRRDHWENVYTGKEVDGVSWWQSVPELSLGLVDRAGVPKDAGVIDVGAGWSTLMDHLVELGHTDLTAVDLSTTALQAIRDRIGSAGEAVVLDVADVLDLHRGRTYALWHDRAVFHFLVDAEARDDYRASLARSLEPGGWLVVATFGPDGPTTCSGLPIVRYTHEELAAEFPDFDLIETADEEHLTPWGNIQQFTAVLLRHRG